MLISVVEIKCKRCGKITLFKNYTKNVTPACVERNTADNIIVPDSFVLSVDTDGVIIDACQDTPLLLAYSRSDFVGKPIADICPLLGDGVMQKEMRASFDSNTPYEIKQNLFFVRDGDKLPTESYCVGAYQNGTSTGYRMINRVCA